MYFFIEIFPLDFVGCFFPFLFLKVAVAKLLDFIERLSHTLVNLYYCKSPGIGSRPPRPVHRMSGVEDE